MIQMGDYRSIDGLDAISEAFELFLIDQFGVLHDGVRPYDGAIECLKNLKASGKNVVLLSNSGKRAAANISRLLEFGFTAASFDHVVTSGEVAWQGIRERTFGPPFVPGNRVFLVGHDDYDYGLDEIGLVPVEDSAAANFILIAASRAPKLSLTQYRDLLAAAADSNVPALCCNPDRMMLTAAGLQPSAGEIASLYRELGGKVTFVGKPYPAIYAAARKRYPGSKNARTLAIGDSIEHDIRGGQNAGLVTALVRTGLSAQLSDEQLNKEATRQGAIADFVLPGLLWESRDD
jgi:HAD superfamily hydrolase (TIGR01459 family)